MPSAAKRAAMLATLTSRLPDNHQRAMEVLNKVNAVYVPCGRDTVIRDTFDAYLAFTLANQRYGRVGKGQAFYLTGISGAGKSDAVEFLFKNHPVLQPVNTDFGPVKPYVSVSLEGPATLANLGNAILAASGYTIKRKIAQSDVWPMLPGELADRSVFLIHIDETQHLLANKSEREALVKSLKGLMNDPEWPLRIVLSGMPETNQMLTTDDQGERRNFSVQLPSINMAEEGFLVEAIIRELCAAAEINCAALLATDLPERIAHAANYQYGRVSEVTAAGIYDAVLNEEKELGRDALARAYLLHSHARGNDDMNPFLVDGWANLKPGYFIVDEASYV